MPTCRWCAGTGEECGCGTGRCDHCQGTGQMADPPFGPLRNVLPDEDVDVLANYWCDPKRDETLGEFIQRVAQRAIDCHCAKEAA